MISTYVRYYRKCESYLEKLSMLIHVSFQLESRGEIFDESVDLVKKLSTADGTDIGPTVRFLCIISKNYIFFR